MVIELDMSKAYDRVKWNFLATTMLKLEFSVGLIKLIMNGISLVSY